MKFYFVTKRSLGTNMPTAKKNFRYSVTMVVILYENTYTGYSVPGFKLPKTKRIANC